MGLQKGLITFEVDPIQLKLIEIRLKNLKNKAPQALKNAINATAREAKKDLVDRVKTQYVIQRSKPDLKKDIRQQNANISTLTAILRIGGKPNELKKHFKTAPNTPAAAAKARVLKSSSLKLLEKRSGIKAFITQFKSGHVTIAQRRGDGRLPTKSLFGPATHKMVGNEVKVYGIVKPKIQENLQKHIEKQITKIMGGK